MTKIDAMPPSPLRRLATLVGVYPDYVSAWGDSKDVQDDSLRALLAALGVAADSDAAVARSLDELEDNDTGGILEPVLVVEKGAEIKTFFRAGRGRGAAVCWRILLEDGRTLDGEALAVRGEAPSLSLQLSGVPIGYHRLEVAVGREESSSALIVVPPRAYTPEAWETEDRRDWAITAQLYSLRSNRNWGIGDFSDLAGLGKDSTGFGASAIGVNPLHALFPANPRHLSPYSPSSRAFLNPVYIDVEAVPEFAECDDARSLAAGSEFQVRLQSARASEFVDYEAVWSLKLAVLRLLHRSFRDSRSRQPQNDRARSFEAFRNAGGEPLERFALFEALQQHFAAEGAGFSWRQWPKNYRDPGSPEVAAFAAAHATEVEFSAYLQWEADRQLGAAADAMRAAGMTTGLYRDVAVGVDPNGAEAWGDKALLVSDAAVGAPPDIYNPKGQNWGLTPFNPVCLRQRAYGPFIAAVRANMRHAGAIRIDHVIGLKRLYWVPNGMEADAGAYIAYPFEELMGIIALESWRNRCFVVGEDLGTVPEGFREDMERRAILSYRLLMFERENGDGGFLPPDAYPKLAAAAVSTHDLPTLAGLWSGRDLEWRRRLALYPSEEDAERDRAFRVATREALIDALRVEGGLSQAAAEVLRGDRPLEPLPELAEAAHRFLARGPSRLMLVQLEDLVGEVEQMNLPGTVDEHPNWRRKLRAELEEIFDDPAVEGLASAIREGRRAPSRREALTDG